MKTKKVTNIAKKIKNGMYLVSGLAGLALSLPVGMMSENVLTKVICIFLFILSGATLDLMLNKNREEINA